MKPKYVLAMLIMSFVFPMSVFSTPIYYTVQGPLGGIWPTVDDSAGIIADWSYDIGDPIKFTFLVDVDADGYYEQNDGTIVYQNDEFHPDGPVRTDYFYAELISGPLLPEKDGGCHNNTDDVANKYYGRNNDIAGGAVFFGSDDSYIRIWNLWFGMDELSIGDHMEIGMGGYDDMGNNSYVYGHGYSITDVSSTFPSTVPEPSTILLVGIGLIGLAGFRKKFKK